MISVELSHRLAAAMQHEMTPDERGMIVDAVEDPDVVEFADLPGNIQALVRTLEARAMPDFHGVPDIPYPDAEGGEAEANVPSMAEAIMAADPR